MNVKNLSDEFLKNTLSTVRVAAVGRKNAGIFQWMKWIELF